MDSWPVSFQQVAGSARRLQPIIAITRFITGGPAAAAWFHLNFDIVPANGRGQYACINCIAFRYCIAITRFAARFAVFTAGAARAWGIALIPCFLFVSGDFIALLIAVAFADIVRSPRMLATGIARIAATVIAIIAVIIIGLFTIITALAARFVLTGLVISNHAEIMVGKLQVIFGLHPVTIMLGILGQLFILIQQLRRIAPCPAVNPVGIMASALIAIATATAAIIITIVIQGEFILICDRAQ